MTMEKRFYCFTDNEQVSVFYDQSICITARVQID